MNVWHEIPQQYITSGKFLVYITMQKGSNKKYEFDLCTGYLRLIEIFYSAACYPVNGGIIPRTLNGLQCPLKSLIICQDPLELHTLVECSPIGLIRIQEKGRVEDVVIALPILENMNGIGFVDSESTLKAMYEEIQYFYHTYNGSVESGVWTSGEISGIKAVDMIEKAIVNYQKRYME